MTISYVPRALYPSANLDVEAQNENLRAIARSIRLQMDARYSTTALRFPLDGVTNADATIARTFSIQAPATLQFQIVRVELVIYAAVGATWTATATTAANTDWPGVSVDTVDVTTEAYGSQDAPLSPNANQGGTVNIVVASASASTITRGYLVIHVTTDRGVHGSTDFVTGYRPTLFSSSTSTSGVTLDAEMQAIATAVAQETGAQLDVRIQCFAVRNLASGASTSITLPSLKRNGADAQALFVRALAPVGATVTGTVDVAGATPAASKAVAGAGVGTASDGTATFASADLNDPQTAASDLTLTIARGADGGAVAPLCYLLVWWA